MIDQPTIDALTASASAWVSAVARGQLTQEQLELLHQAFLDPDLEAAIRIQFRAGRIVLEVSNGTHKVELHALEVEPARLEDGFGHERTGVQ